MSDLVPSVVPLVNGLDLSSPELLAKPGDLLDCLNYEITDVSGYRRIDGFQRYDGNVSLKDVPNARVYTAVVDGSGTIGAGITNEAFEDSFGNIIGFVFSAVPISGGPDATLTYVSFSGDLVVAGSMSTTPWSFTSTATAHTEATQTQAQMIALETYLRSVVEPLPYTAVGLQWYNNRLYAVVPLLMIPYKASDVNQTVQYNINSTLTSTEGGTATLLDKVVTQEATALLREEGYLIVYGESGDWEAPVIDTDTLSGAVSVFAGSVYHQPGNLTGVDSTACYLWRANRPPTYTSVSKLFSEPGWGTVGILPSFTLTVELSTAPTAVPELNTIRKNNSVAESTYYFKDAFGVINATVLDYFVVSGSFADGNAVLRLQVASISLTSGSTTLDITNSFDMYSDSAATVKIADVTTRMSFNALPGFPQLTDAVSRYEFKVANFYASDETRLMYGVSGASRAFVFDGTYTSFIYTQDDDTLDIPRHLENHHLHLALGFAQGSVQLSVAGEPTNFSGLDGASDIGVGDRVTGLMEVEGTTLVVFCEQSIWSIVGTSVDNFQTQTIAPNTGCIEYSLANCGFPVYLDSRGVSTLQTSARYGDFVGARLSAAVSPWLVPRCRSGLLAINNASGIACAVPIRTKNQYRLFFNDGEILTMTFMAEEGKVGFTFQRYYLEQEVISDTMHRLVPVCATSEIDTYGVERSYVAHYNADSPVESQHVYELDSGNSFDGNYIPHHFDTNWFFGSAPSTFTTINGVRMYGRSRGFSNIDLSVVGQQADFDFSGAELTSTPAAINLPRTAGAIFNDYKPVTTRTDISGRGLSIKFRFSGSNTDLTLPEPSHICQVLITYASPEGAFDL